MAVMSSSSKASDSYRLPPVDTQMQHDDADPIPQDVPPSYEMATANDLIHRTASVRDDGRVNVHVDSVLYRTLSRIRPDLKHPPPPAFTDQPPTPSQDPNLLNQFPIKLNIVIQVVGSRGDVQPFIALGTELQKHGHRVRLATHNIFDSFVCGAGLEFFPIGGNPSELMAYMVRNPGLIPSLKSLRRGDVQKKREMVAEMLDGCWRSCLEPDPVSGVPFVADAIVANPPSFAHVHCAQAMGIPVHLMFTMPWTSTRSFSHPLTNLKFGDKAIDPQTANYLSYAVVEWLTWQGLGDVINTWRKSIDLEEVPMSEGALLTETLKVPFTYCWSPALVGKPPDWPSHIGKFGLPIDSLNLTVLSPDVCGFFFREPPKYTPPPELASFLSSGPPPIYIGFGSIVIDNPETMTKTLISAVRKAGVRAIISRGWSKLGGSDEKDIIYVGDCPHEWLFAHVAAVIHHGGAGTTACGLLNARPTTIVPFFGDQPFWGDMVAASGAGPSPIPYKRLNADNLAHAIRFCITPEAESAAQTLSQNMKMENGVAAAVRSYHANLPLESLRCDILDDQPASWVYSRGRKRLRLSKLAASVLSAHLKIDVKKLSVNETKTIHITNRRWDPISGTTSALLGTTADMAKSTADIILRPVQTYQRQKAASASQNLPAGGPDALVRFHERGTRESSSGRGCVDTAAIVGASAAGVGGFFKSWGRGFYIDIPMAAADGFRAVPRMYGEVVPEHEPIRDWQSGARVGGMNFVTGICGGFSDLVMQPYHGASTGGFAGAAKGVGKGVVGLTSKTVSAAVGIVAYPGHGIYQSIRTLVRSKAREQITEARQKEGDHLIRSDTYPVDVSFVLAEFEKRLVGGG